MGRLAGFSYREIVKRLKQLGFEFHRDQGEGDTIDVVKAL